mgnify:CR=1 FL=1
MLLRASQRLGALREHATRAACRTATVTNYGGSVSIGVSNASATAAWRGSRGSSIARQLSSEPAGSAASLPNADSLEKGLKGVLGKKLAPRADLAAVLGNPLIVQAAVTVLHRVRMRCGDLLRVL